MNASTSRYKLDVDLQVLTIKLQLRFDPRAPRLYETSMCVLESSTLRGVREGPLSDVSYDSLISILDFTTLTQFVWVHFRMSRTIRSLAIHSFLLHLIARPCPAECLYGCLGSSPGLVSGLPAHACGSPVRGICRSY